MKTRSTPQAMLTILSKTMALFLTGLMNWDAAASASCPALPYPLTHLEAQRVGAFRRFTAAPHTDYERLHVILYTVMLEEEGTTAYSSFYNSASYLFTTLQRAGVPPSRIHSLMGETFNPNRPQNMYWTRLNERNQATTQPTPIPRDLDCNGTNDVSGPATPSELRRVAVQIRAELREGDKVLILINGHGTAERGFAMAGLSPAMSPEILSEVLSIFPSTTPLAVLVDTCFSGAVITSQVSRSNACILTASRADQTSYAGYYANFSLLFGSIIGRVLPTGQALERSEFQIPHDMNRALTISQIHAEIRRIEPRLHNSRWDNWAVNSPWPHQDSQISSEILPSRPMEAPQARRQVQDLINRLEPVPDEERARPSANLEDGSRFRRRGLLRNALQTSIEEYVPTCDQFRF